MSAPATKHDPGAELLSAKGVAAAIGKSYSWVIHNRHRLPAPRWIGSELRWPRAEIEAWVESQREGRVVPFRPAK